MISGVVGQDVRAEVLQVVRVTDWRGRISISRLGRFGLAGLWRLVLARLAVLSGFAVLSRFAVLAGFRRFVLAGFSVLSDLARLCGAGKSRLGRIQFSSSSSGFSLSRFPL